MKKIIVLVLIGFILILSSCSNNELSNNTDKTPEENIPSNKEVVDYSFDLPDDVKESVLSGEIWNFYEGAETGGTLPLIGDAQYIYNQEIGEVLHDVICDSYPMVLIEKDIDDFIFVCGYYEFEGDDGWHWNQYTWRAFNNPEDIPKTYNGMVFNVGIQINKTLPAPNLITDEIINSKYTFFSEYKPLFDEESGMNKSGALLNEVKYIRVNKDLSDQFVPVYNNRNTLILFPTIIHRRGIIEFYEIDDKFYYYMLQKRVDKYGQETIYKPGYQLGLFRDDLKDYIYEDSKLIEADGEKKYYYYLSLDEIISLIKSGYLTPRTHDWEN